MRLGSPIFRSALAPAWLLALFAPGALLACGAGLPQPTQAQVAAAREREPNVSLADLTRGHDLYVQKCGNCHALRDPVSLNREQWDHEIHEMRSEQNVRLSEAEHQDILRFLDAASRAPAR